MGGGAQDSEGIEVGVMSLPRNCVCLAGEVRMPSGKTARPNITDNKDGTITVRYAPTEKGLHQMGIKYDGNHIPGESGARLAWVGLGGAHCGFLFACLLSTTIY